MAKHKGHDLKNKKSHSKKTKKRLLAKKTMLAARKKSK